MSPTQRWRWLAIATAGIIAGALLPKAALRDAATHGPVSDVALSASPAYVLLAPLCNVLDALSSLSVRQHYALLFTVAIALLAWLGMRWIRRAQRPFRHDVGIVCGGILLLLAIYVVCIGVPRPMMALTVTDPDVVVVDFHSHTNFSWDGRRGFTLERNREWHHAGGWHAAYITDHLDDVEGPDPDMIPNPRRAGDGTVLLPGVECQKDGEHLLVLGVTPRDFPPRGAHPKRCAKTYDRERAVIQTIPGDLTRVAARGGTRIGVLVGIELSDGSPRGLDQAQREHGTLLAIARAQNLAVVAGSNNHGRTYTPLAWNLLRIPGWRELTPEALGLAIEDRLRRDRQHAVTVVERYTADPGATTFGLAATVPAVAWHTLATLTWTERASWIAWAWVAVGLRVQLRRSFRRLLGGN